MPRWCACSKVPARIQCLEKHVTQPSCSRARVSPYNMACLRFHMWQGNLMCCVKGMSPKDTTALPYSPGGWGGSSDAWPLMILHETQLSRYTCLHQGVDSITRAHCITTASTPHVATAQWTHWRLQMCRHSVRAKAGTSGAPIYRQNTHHHGWRDRWLASRHSRTAAAPCSSNRSSRGSRRSSSRPIVVQLERTRRTRRKRKSHLKECARHR